MMECDVIEFVTRGCRDNFAGQTIALQSRIQTKSVAKINWPCSVLTKAYSTLRMHVERLVRRNRPRRRCPDHDVAFCATGTPNAALSLSCSANGKPRQSPNRFCLGIPLPPRPAPILQSKHQFTGFKPRSNVAFVQNFAQRTDFVRFRWQNSWFCTDCPIRPIRPNA